MLSYLFQSIANTGEIHFSVLLFTVKINNADCSIYIKDNSEVLFPINSTSNYFEALDYDLEIIHFLR